MFLLGRQITSSASTIREAHNIALVIIAGLSLPVFIWWVGRQERLGRPAIIPNSVWRKTEFTCVCIAVFLTWSMFNAYGYWCTLFFQIIQDLSPLQTALRFLPLVITGFLTNIFAGLFIHKIPAIVMVLVGGIFSAVAPLLFATQNPSWTYWAAGFPAMCLSVISSDLLFNISNLVITASFSAEDQALSGGVFNTVAQLGNAIGLAVTAVIASAATSSADSKSSVTALEGTLKGYQAALWACFAAAAVSTLVGILGLRKSGKVGLKKD